MNPRAPVSAAHMYRRPPILFERRVFSFLSRYPEIQLVQLGHEAVKTNLKAVVLTIARKTQIARVKRNCCLLEDIC